MEKRLKQSELLTSGTRMKAKTLKAKQEQVIETPNATGPSGKAVFHVNGQRG